MLKKTLYFSAFIVALSALAPRASAALVDYRAKIIAKDSSGTPLGYVAEDPNYWTPLLTPNSGSALVVDFRLNGTSGSQINLAPENSGQGYPYFGLVEGRDSTTPNIAPGSFNYLYLDGTTGTAPGAAPQHVQNYFAVSTGLDKTSESAVWIIDINALTLGAQWINTDSSTPVTFSFVQSNHVYAGGDPDAFHSRFPAPVSTVALFLEIVEQTPVEETVPDPSSTCTLLLLGLAPVFCFRPLMRRPA